MIDCTVNTLIVTAVAFVIWRFYRNSRIVLDGKGGVK